MFHFLSIGGDVFLGFGVLLKVSVGVFVFKGYRCPYIVFALGGSGAWGLAPAGSLTAGPRLCPSDASVLCPI